MFKTCKNKKLHFILVFIAILFVVVFLLVPLISKSLYNKSNKGGDSNLQYENRNVNEPVTSKSISEENKNGFDQSDVAQSKTEKINEQAASKDISKDKQTEDDKPDSAAQNSNATKIGEIIYFFNKKDPQSNVFSGLLLYGKENNIEVKYNNNSKYGVFVESIGGVKNGDEGKYWQYYINGVLGDVAADKKTLKESDVVVWKFEKVPF